MPLVGVLSGLGADEHETDEAEEGALLEVAVAGPTGKTLALDILRDHGAAHVSEE